MLEFRIVQIMAGMGEWVSIFKTLLRYPHGREGVFVPGGLDFLAHARQKSSYIVSLTAPRLAFFMG